MKHEKPKGSLTCDCEVIHEEFVQKARSAMIKDSAVSELANFFKVFGDRTRIKILQALSACELCVCDIAIVLNMTKSAISHQLRFLREVNLVKARRDGKNVFYSLADDHVQTILSQGLEHVNE